MMSLLSSSQLGGDRCAMSMGQAAPALTALSTARGAAPKDLRPSTSIPRLTHCRSREALKKRLNGASGWNLWTLPTPPGTIVLLSTK